MAGDKIREVLYADHALYERFGEVADLPHRGREKRGDDAEPERDRQPELRQVIQDDAGNDGRDRAADAALDGLVRGDGGGDLMLAEALAAEEGKAVAHPGGQAGDRERLEPDVADADDHYHRELEAWVRKAEHRTERALAGHVLPEYAREQREIHSAGEEHHVPEQADLDAGEAVDQGQHRLGGEVCIHDAGRAADLKLFKVAAELVRAEDAGRGEKDDAGHR